MTTKEYGALICLADKLSKRAEQSTILAERFTDHGTMAAYAGRGDAYQQSAALVMEVIDALTVPLEPKPWQHEG